MATGLPNVSGEEPHPSTDIEMDEENSGNREATELCMDCGFTAWMQVLGSWILFANTWFVWTSPWPTHYCESDTHKQHRELTNSFGVLQTYYINVLLSTSTPSAIAWIGSTQLFLTMLVGVFAGWLLDAGHLRLLLVSGTFLEFFGKLMTSFCTQYWQILLAQGICVGSGFLGPASVAIIPLYFSRKRMIATGIAATGSSQGKPTNL
jgi:MFS family permease